MRDPGRLAENPRGSLCDSRDKLVFIPMATLRFLKKL